MKLARYLGNGEIAIVDEPVPACPPGGLLVKTEASGLCSGELMDWYMDRKVPHVLGHEVAGIITESGDDRFPVGSRVFVHHHAPCLRCSYCARSLFVQCEQWKRTKLIPGGMAEYFAASKENLTDTLLVDDLRAIDAALIEPLGCVAKSLLVAGVPRGRKLSHAVVGLGSMGLMHALVTGAVAYDINPARVAYARSLGIDARSPEERKQADTIYICPGTNSALDFALSIANPGATVVLFAPMAPGDKSVLDLHDLYFSEISLIPSYSCGPVATRTAAGFLRDGRVKAEQVVSDFIGIDELPDAYRKMKKGEILKAMVLFES